MPLHFVPITEENRREVENLQLFPEQRSYIESVPECLAEAEQTREWRTVGIYDGPTVVGFAMYGCFAQPPAVCARCWRISNTSGIRHRWKNC